jgi:hypothetical protein
MSGTPLNAIQIPPIRTGLLDPAANGDNNGAGPQKTAKEWYYFWNQVRRRVNQDTTTLAGLVTYGAAAAMPDPKTMPDGALYVQEDRNSLYVNEGGHWQYVAGTMWGTLNPDQRPTNLGVYDAGFNFRSVDTNTAYAPREYLWSQSEWIEVTQVLYGTHAGRPPANETTPARTLYVETDRGNVIYQQQGNAWYFLAGTMWGTMTPDQRPADLGANDTGFAYRSSDIPARSFVWPGSAWQETTANDNTAQIAYASATLTLTTTAQTVPGTTLTLAKAGRYLVIGVFYFYFSSVDQGNTLVGSFQGMGSVAAFVISATNVTAGGTVAQQWLYTAAAPNAPVSLAAYKSGGTGTSTLLATHTSISAIWLGP